MKKLFKNNIKLIIGIIIGVIISGGIVYAATTYQSNSIAHTLSNGTTTTVDAALNTLYQKADKCIMPLDIEVGKYISLTPDKSSYSISPLLTGYTSVQTINPSELNLWRVIDIHSDGSIDMVSEYVSSTYVRFSGTTGYANYVGALNTIAAQYQKAGYTIGARHMGYDGQTEYIADTSAFDGSTNAAPGTTTTPNPTSGTGEEYSGGVLGDTLYLKDYQLVGNVYKSDTTTYGTTGLKAYKVGTTTATVYWLASRRFVYGSATSFDFEGRSINTSGSWSYYSGLRVFSNSWRDDDSSRALRPILTLKSGITISGGAGTKASPYTLS